MVSAIMSKRKNHKKTSKHSRRTSHSGSSDAWLFGTHAVMAALANPKRQCQRLVLAAQSKDDFEILYAEAAQKGGHEDLIAEIRDKNEISALLSPGAVHQGVALLTVPLPARHIEDVCKRAETLETATVVVLDQATDPHNIGAVMRSALAFGALAVIVQDRHAPDITGTLAKTASGAVENLDYIKVTNLVRALDDLKDAGFWCLGLDGSATEPLDSLDLPEKTSLVLGAEGKGLRRLSLEACDFTAKIPMTDAMESLNLSVAAAVSLYEVFRRTKP
jgi:23S rRNA (guanosine2251-2'-O)-methyltransferase